VSRFVRLRRLLYVLVGAQLVLAGLGAARWYNAVFDDPLPDQRPVLSPATPKPVTLESAYPLAAERALQWDEDARLIMVSAQIDWPLSVPPGPLRELPGGGWLTYVFVRDIDGEGQSLGLLIERYSGVIVDEAIADWGGPAPDGSLDLGALPVGSMSALVSAESAGGTEFRRSCPAARHETRLSLDLGSQHGDGGSFAQATPVAGQGTPAPTEAAAPVWLVGYRDVRDGGRSPLQFRVDSQTATASSESRAVPNAEGCPA
jgi:hypothetical protein